MTDTGRGMTIMERARAFEPFFTTKGVGEGSGLGLSQTYGSVRHAKGTITLDSKPGHGTTVLIHLPVAVAAISERGSKQVVPFTPGQTARTGGGRILVVEDDELVRDCAVETLRDLGYEVLEAGDADAGWEILAAADRIDLLCTDVMMPGTMNGFELAQKARDRRPHLRLVYMSGYPDKALETGRPIDRQAPYLAKPFTGNDLAEGVQRALRA